MIWYYGAIAAFAQAKMFRSFVPHAKNTSVRNA
jgi:hypothetical protein